MKARDLDNKFDKNEEVLQHFDIKKADRPGQKHKRVNVDFPSWVVDSLDKEAKRLGVTRQSVIKVWIAEKLKKKAA